MLDENKIRPQFPHDWYKNVLFFPLSCCHLWKLWFCLRRSSFNLKVGRYILCDRILRTQLTTFPLPERVEFTTQQMLSNKILPDLFLKMPSNSCMTIKLLLVFPHDSPCCNITNMIFPDCICYATCKCGWFGHLQSILQAESCTTLANAPCRLTLNDTIACLQNLAIRLGFYVLCL